MFFGCCCTEQGGEIVAESAAGTASPPAVPATESVWKANDKQEEPAKLKSIDEAAPGECQVVLAAAAEQLEPEVSVFRDPFTINLQKKPGLTKVGLDVTHHGGFALKIKKMKDGLVTQWNTDHQDQPELIVKEGDFITKVNGTESAPKTLVEMMVQEDNLELVITPGAVA